MSDAQQQVIVSILNRGCPGCYTSRRRARRRCFNPQPGFPPVATSRWARLWPGRTWKKFQSSTGVSPVATALGRQRRYIHSVSILNRGFPRLLQGAGMGAGARAADVSILNRGCPRLLPSASVLKLAARGFNPQPGFRPVATRANARRHPPLKFQSSTGVAPGCYTDTQADGQADKVSILNRASARLLPRNEAGLVIVLKFQSSTGLSPGCY